MNTPSNVVHIGRMTEEQYERERAKLRETYGDSKQQAGVRWEQELARLFYRSGWTQEQLAKKESKSQPWIACQLRFGRFLHFITTVIKPESLPSNLSEWRFRAYWDRAASERDERARFREVLRLIQSDPVMAPRRPKIGRAIKEAFADGKWHPFAAIASEIDAPEDHVRTTLAGMQEGNYSVKCECKKVGTDFHYRLFPQDRTISLKELKTKLTPLVEGLIVEGKKNMATMSPGTVAYLAGSIKKLLDEWTE